MFFKPAEPASFEGWKCIQVTGSAEEAHLTAAFLNDSGIPAEVVSKKDTSYVFPSGMMGDVYVYVEEARFEEADSLLKTDFGDVADE